VTELTSSAPSEEADREPPAGPGEVPETGVSRWSLQAPGIDVFWPVLAAVLIAIVVVVATVAHSSMAAVGVGTPRTDWSPLPTPSPEESFVVVQVASFPTRDEGQDEVRELRRSGLDADVLRSDRYAPMKKGWYVVYVGPFPATAEGRDQAHALTERIDGSLVRTLHRR
jgi:hypothetical protein